MIAIVGAAAVALAACGNGKKPVPSGGAAVQVSTAALSTSVTEVSVEVTDGAGASVASVTLTRSNGTTFEGRIEGLPLGEPLTFTATAVSLEGNVYRGSAPPITIELPSRFATVVIKLQEAEPPSQQNHAPRLASITTTARFVAPGNTLTATVDATDADGDALTYAWTAIPALGSFANATSASTLWTAPNVAPSTDVVLAVTVSDGHGGIAKASALVTVTSASTLQNVAVVAILNDAPTIAGISNEPLFDGTNTPFDNQLTLDATDADGPAPLTFLWEVDLNAAPGCVGDFFDPLTLLPDATIQSPRFVPSLAGDGGLCAARVTVTDGLGATNVGTVVFAVDLPPTGTAPRLTFAYQSAVSVGPGAAAFVKALFVMGPDSLIADYTFTANRSSPDPDPLGITPASITDLDLMQVQFPATCDPRGPVVYTITATALDPVTSAPTSATKNFVITFCP